VTLFTHSAHRRSWGYCAEALTCANTMNRTSGQQWVRSQTGIADVRA